MAKKQTLNLAIRGLFTHQDTLSEVPNGALNVADNIVIDREGIASSRRGFDLYNQTLEIEGGFKQIFHYRDRLFAHSNTSSAGTLYRDSLSGSWDSVGSLQAPDPDNTQAGFKIRGAEANRNAYITSDVGILKLDDPEGSLTNAGMAKGLGGTATPSGASGFQSDDTNVAYRIVWGIKDANLNLLLGAPSQRIIGTNTSGGTRDEDLSFVVPDGITTNHFYQIYRSNESATAADEPDDELQLVYENNPTSGQLTAKTVTFTDNLPNSLKRASLYTNQSQEGIAQSNEPPPFCKDMTVYKNFTFFANTKQKQRMIITLIAVGSPDGYQVGDTITIDGIVFTGVASSPTNDQFIVDTSGTPSENIDATARSLINAINISTSNVSFYGYYLSGFEDLPGKILLEERGIGDPEFYVTSDRGEAFDPILPSSGTDQASDNEEKQHRVYFSKNQQPEAVPLLNYFNIGSADEPIQRIISLRESVFIFKPDGIFRIIGETAVNFRVLTADNTSAIRAPEAAVTHNNTIILWTEQGIVSVSENGDVAILSRPIEQDLLRISTYAEFETGAFAVTYESDRKYMVFVPQVDATGEKVCCGYIYNSLTKSWTNWNVHGFLEDVTTPGKYTPAYDYGFGAGLVDPIGDKLYLGTLNKEVNDNVTLIERKDWALQDYVDTEIVSAVYSIPDLTTIVLDSYIGPAVGDADDEMIDFTVQQGSRKQTITANSDQLIDGSQRTVLTVESTDLWEVTNVELLTPIQAVVEWVPNHTGNPGVLKHFSEMTMFFDSIAFREVDVRYATNFVGPTDTVAIPPSSNASAGGNGWGLFAWGEVPWGEEVVDRQDAIRTYISREAARANWIIIQVGNNEALAKFELNGLSLIYSVMSSKFRGTISG